MERAIHNEDIRIIFFTIIYDFKTLANQIQRQNIYYPIWIVPYRIVKTRQVSYQISDGCYCIAMYMQDLNIWIFPDIPQTLLVHKYITGWLIVEKTPVWINVSSPYLA